MLLPAQRFLGVPEDPRYKVELDRTRELESSGKVPGGPRNNTARCLVGIVHDQDNHGV